MLTTVFWVIIRENVAVAAGVCGLVAPAIFSPVQAKLRQWIEKLRKMVRGCADLDAKVAAATEMLAEANCDLHMYDKKEIEGHKEDG